MIHIQTDTQSQMRLCCRTDFDAGVNKVVVAGYRFLTILRSKTTIVRWSSSLSAQLVPSAQRPSKLPYITNPSSLATDKITIPSPYVKDPIAFINHSSHVILLSIFEFPSETAPNDLYLSVILDFATRRHPSYDSRFQS